MSLSRFKHATPVGNWDTVMKKGDTRVYFSTWNPCNWRTTPNASVGCHGSASMGYQSAFFSGKEGIVVDHARNDEGILFVEVQFEDGTKKKYRCTESRRYNNPKYLKNRNQIDL